MSDFTIMSHLTDAAEHPDIPFLCADEWAFCAGCRGEFACDPALHIHIFGNGFFLVAACSEACAITWLERQKPAVEGKG